MGKNLEFMRITEDEDEMVVMVKVMRETVNSLVNRGFYVYEFECTYDEYETYQFIWKEKWNGFGHLAAFVEPHKITEFVKENKRYAEEFGFDPLNPLSGLAIVTKVYVYSPNSFPEEGIRSLLSATNGEEGSKDVHIILVTTDEIIEKYGP